MVSRKFLSFIYRIPVFLVSHSKHSKQKKFISLIPTSIQKQKFETKINQIVHHSKTFKNKIQQNKFVFYCHTLTQSICIAEFFSQVGNHSFFAFQKSLTAWGSESVQGLFPIPSGKYPPVPFACVRVCVCCLWGI
jgi:hypothetical protein